MALCTRKRVGLALAYLLGSSAFSSAAAQAPPELEASLAAGASRYDLAGTGTGLAAATGLAWRPTRGLVLEPGATLFTYTPQFGARVTYVMPELSLQGELGIGRFRPFLGVGGGAAVSVGGRGGTTKTLHAALGCRVAVSGPWSIRTEARVRSVSPWSGTTADLLLGVSRAVR